MTIKPWKILETNYLRDKCELSNNQILEPLVLEYGTWVTILALTKDSEALMIRQYRHGIQQVIWEFPGGGVEDGENPLDAAKRELLEETGYTGQEFFETGMVSPNPASQTNFMYSFLALNAERVGKQSLDETEEIEVFLKPLDEVIEMAKKGDIFQALHISTLFAALAHLDRII